MQKKESAIQMQEHVQRFDELKNLQQQDSEKIKVLYELMLQAQNGSLNQIESAVLEQKIELAADQIGQQDSDRAKALKAIADKQKKEADALLEKKSPGRSTTLPKHINCTLLTNTGTGIMQRQ